jgi:hypothetical protein
MKLRPGQVGAEREFKARLASGAPGMERYVEWDRVV